LIGSIAGFTFEFPAVALLDDFQQAEAAIGVAVLNRIIGAERPASVRVARPRWRIGSVRPRTSP